MTDTDLRSLERRAEASGLATDRVRLRLARERAGLLPDLVDVHRLDAEIARRLSIVNSGCGRERATPAHLAEVVSRAAEAPAIGETDIYRSSLDFRSKARFRARALFLAVPINLPGRRGLLIGIGLTTSTNTGARHTFGKVWHGFARALPHGPPTSGVPCEPTGSRIDLAWAIPWARNAPVRYRSKTFFADRAVAADWARQRSNGRELEVRA